MDNWLLIVVAGIFLICIAVGLYQGIFEVWTFSSCNPDHYDSGDVSVTLCIECTGEVYTD